MIVSPDWSQPFEIMCYASGVALGAILGQRIGKLFHPIYYSRNTLNTSQKNYMVTEQELSIVVYTFEKF